MVKMTEKAEVCATVMDDFGNPGAAFLIRELSKQRAELLEALKMVKEAAIDMRGEDFNLTTEQWSIFHAAIANAEK